MIQSAARLEADSKTSSSTSKDQKALSASPVDKPLFAAMVKKRMKARIAQNEHKPERLTGSLFLLFIPSFEAKQRRSIRRGAKFRRNQVFN